LAFLSSARLTRPGLGQCEELSRQQVSVAGVAQSALIAHSEDTPLSCRVGLCLKAR